MQITEISRDLGTAIDMVEEILNGNGGEEFLDTIREFKLTKEIDAENACNLSKYFG